MKYSGIRQQFDFMRFLPTGFAAIGEVDFSGVAMDRWWQFG
jgi:hypothetical protein